MKAEKISDALNFLDEDLIAECDNMIQSRASKKAPRKAKIVPLFGSIAAAAIVLIVGGAILLNFNNSKSSTSDRSNVKSETVHVNSVSEDSASIALDDSTMNEDSSVGAGAGDTEQYFDNSASRFVSATFTFDGEEYLLGEALTAGQRNGNAVGESLGTVEESDNDDLIDAEVFVYTPDTEKSVVVYVADIDTYFVAKKTEA